MYDKIARDEYRAATRDVQVSIDIILVLRSSTKFCKSSAIMKYHKNKTSFIKKIISINVKLNSISGLSYKPA